LQGHHRSSAPRWAAALCSNSYGQVNRHAALVGGQRVWTRRFTAVPFQDGNMHCAVYPVCRLALPDGWAKQRYPSRAVAQEGGCLPGCWCPYRPALP
jgi:hypothetical protein